VGIDMRAPAGREVLLKIAATADVVVENFRPGVLASHRLDWPVLSAGNPRLIMLSISGFGQAGPEAQRAAYAGVIHAESGYLARQADHTGGPVADTRYSSADTITGLHGLVAILAALRVRDLAGAGQHIDLSMLEAFVATDDYTHWSLDGLPVGQGAGEVWDTRTGPIIVMGDFRWIWRCATDRLGLVDPTPPGASLADKVRLRRRAWADHVGSFDDRAALVAELDRANLAWGEVRSGRDVFASPTIRHRRTIVSVDDRVGGSRPAVQSPYRFSRSESGITGPAPLRGEHNREVLAGWLGATAGEIERLTATGVLQSEASQDQSEEVQDQMAMPSKLPVEAVSDRNTQA
jgi:crotonobetainyl-CoA:carnitine CoA-transferase CaiB-like acyl-CoA transferase